ncbi:histidine kinase [Sphaerimonospora mesophila]|uniref:sensor histidine kinase n=1 Tax=Sphaerimonospora mesophila TaxID=37483 RepID=UPI000A5963E9
MRWIRRSSAREVSADLLLWAVLCLPVVLVPGDPYDWSPRSGNALVGLVVAGVAVVTLAVLVSRAAPLAAMLIALVMGPWRATEALATVTLWPLNTVVKVGPLNGFTLAIVMFSYFAGRRTARPRPALYVFGVIFLFGGIAWAVTTSGPVPRETVWIPILTGVLISSVFPWTVGRYLRQRVEHRERERRMVADQARLRERARIAQDMHDSLGHELALIALRAGALEVAPDLPERHRAAAGELRQTAGATTERLRQVIGVLREDGESPPMAPYAEGIAALVERAAASGMAVELDGGSALAGSWQGDDWGRSLVHGAAYRVVQEALTNAARHAPGAPVSVRVEDAGGVVTVSVSNPAPAGATRPGMGLVGLRERVRLAGGAFDAGWRDGRFEVIARLPFEQPFDQPFEQPYERPYASPSEQPYELP